MQRHQVCVTIGECAHLRGISLLDVAAAALVPCWTLAKRTRWKRRVNVSR